ncbi:MAG: hypothetical protein ACRC6U_10920 [Fusobacteriaceae bacterium]
MELQKVGIDTIDLMYEGLIDVDKLKNKAVMKEKSIEVNGNTKIVFKPSKIFSNGIHLSNALEVKGAIAMLEMEIGVLGRITRVDISADTIEHLYDNKALSRLFLSCLAFKRRKKENIDIFRTIKNVEEEGNIKIRSKRVETTIYNCEHKLRIANTRIENRVKDIRNEFTYEEVIKSEIEYFIEELQDIEEFVEKIEDDMVIKLEAIFRNKSKKNFGTFTEFVVWGYESGYIPTVGTLKKLMKSVGLKIGYKKFVENFRKNRTESLKFVSKKDIKELNKKLRIGLKGAIKK